jgi:hypothetical protein
MFKIKVSEQILQHCASQVDLFNFGQRNQANGTKEQQLTGIIGQSVVMHLFGLGLVNGESGFDDGTDIAFAGFNIDVKTMGRTTDVRPNYTNNFLKLQDYFQTEIYIFCSYNKIKAELTVCGWITKSAFTEKRKFFQKGSIRYRTDGSSFTTFADLYEIDMSELQPCNSIEELKSCLQNLKK